MMKWYFFLVVGVSIANIGCGGKKYESHDELTQKAPEWVVKGDGAFSTDKGAMIHGVGVMSYNPNVALQREAADGRARQAIAKVLHTYVGSFLKDFMQSHTDFMAPEQSSSVQFVSSISKSVTDTNLIGVKIVDRWTDPAGNLYSLATIDYDTIARSIKEKVSEAVRLQKAAFLSEKSDQALDALNQELDKRRTNPY